MRQLHEFQKHLSMLRESRLLTNLFRLLANQYMRQCRIRNKQNMSAKS